MHVQFVEHDFYLKYPYLEKNKRYYFWTLVLQITTE